MQIIKYPHPTLRHKSKPLKRVDAELHKIVRNMFDLMYEARGVGLAANQVDLPIRLFVVNTEADPDNGQELVFINPVISLPKGNEFAEEGCLSIPKVFGDVRRAKEIQFNAYNLQGEEIKARIDGFLARVIQHETDHLDGVLFLDRIAEDELDSLNPKLAAFSREFDEARGTGEIPDDEAIMKRLEQIESQYC